ncbi:hypothetical protein [Pseudomonas bohemica]|uniref:hypothetical protein n=1 Tax=Pseudomonas bohemica TaxID=2044872 RepID=UPI0018FE5D48|nr:hypothetical protein [Pseudomonas bohemica]
MSVAPTMSAAPDEELPTADQDVDPDALDDEDARDEAGLGQQPSELPKDWLPPPDGQSERPKDWDEPPAAKPVPPAHEPTPLSDDLR